MRGKLPSKAKDTEDYEDVFLHSTIGGNRIKSHSTRQGHHRLSRPYSSSATSTATPPTSPTSASASRPPALSAFAVSSYLENLPSLNLNLATSPPPRPPRPPGGLLGISNGRGMGYGRSLGSTYDSPVTTHGSFNGHVRSGANLYGGKNYASGPTITKPTHHRPSMSVFPIQKALEIAMKESRLLAAASSRGGAGSTGTGLSTGMTFVRELRRARHTRGAIITEHSSTHTDPTLDMSMTDPSTGTSEEQEDSGVIQDGSPSRTTTRFGAMAMSGSGPVEDGDIRIRRPPVTLFDSKPHYPGIAHMPHSLTPQTGALALRQSQVLPNFMPARSWQHSPSTSTLPATATMPFPALAAHPSMDSVLSSSSAAPYQPHFSPLLSCPSSFSATNPSSTVPSAPPSAVHAVRELLDSHPAPSPYCVDDKKRSPLHFAAASGDLELVEFLLERGVRPDCGRDIAGNMPLHLAIISNRIDVVAALLKAGADMTLASPMTHKTPLDLAESRLSYLLSRAQEAAKYSEGFEHGYHSHYNQHQHQQIATRTSFHGPSQSPALLHQIKGIVSLLRPYVVRQQKLQHGERQKERQKERSWDRADKYMRQQPQEGSSSSLWGLDPQHSEDNYGDMEDDDDEDEDNGMSSHGHRRLSVLDPDGDLELEEELPPYTGKPKKMNRRLPRRMDADETEVALESLMNGLSLLEANRKQLEQQHHQQQELQQQQPVFGGASNGAGVPQSRSRYGSGGQDSVDGNLADSELDPRSEQEVDDALPDLLEQVQQVLEAIKLNEGNG